MKRTLVLALTLLAPGALAWAEVKIGLINSSEIVEKSRKGIEIQQRLETLQSQKQGQLEAMQEKVKGLEKELMSPGLGEPERQAKATELEAQRKNLKRTYEDAQMEFQRMSQRELLALEKEIMPLIQSYGASHGFTVIYDAARSGIVYFDSAIDITKEVIRALDNGQP